MNKTTYKKKSSPGGYRKAPGKRPGILRWVLAGLFLAIFLIFFTGNKSLIKLYSLHQQKEKLKQQKQELLKTNKELREEIDKLKNDKKYIEKMAREKYNMKKKNEDVYMVEPR